MRRTVDVAVVFILLIAVFSIVFLKEGIGVIGITGNVVSEQAPVETVLYPNTYYKFQYCLSTEPGIIEVGIVDRSDKFELIDRVKLYDTYYNNGDVHYSYKCENGIVYQVVNN